MKDGGSGGLIARFVGSTNLPGPNGSRLNASARMAVLTLDASTLRIHVRAFALPLFSDFVVRLDDIASAFPLRRTWFLFRGIGLELSDGQIAYFWTRHITRVLSVLQERGVVVASTPRRAVGLVSGQLRFARESHKPQSQHAPSVATLPQIRAWVWTWRWALILLVLPALAGSLVSVPSASRWLIALIGGLVACALYFGQKDKRGQHDPSPFSDYFGAAVIALVVGFFAFGVSVAIFNHSGVQAELPLAVLVGGATGIGSSFFLLTRIRGGSGRKHEVNERR